MGADAAAFSDRGEELAVLLDGGLVAEGADVVEVQHDAAVTGLDPAYAGYFDAETDK
ncbi:MAG: hypothetical protein KY464_18155 [Gemmatimonadetes bacterium]|nr:hypothetical protein [Gemmatimonadota bacterium]